MSSKQKNNKTIDKFYIMTSKNIIWGVAGLIIGLIINDFVIYISNKLKIKSLFIQNLLQITICAVVIAFFHTYYLFGWDWQHVMPELFFISFFFGVQYKMLNNIQNTYVIDNKTHNDT